MFHVKRVIRKVSKKKRFFFKSRENDLEFTLNCGSLEIKLIKRNDDFSLEKK